MPPSPHQTRGADRVRLPVCGGSPEDKRSRGVLKRAPRRMRVVCSHHIHLSRPPRRHDTPNDDEEDGGGERRTHPGPRSCWASGRRAARASLPPPATGDGAASPRRRRRSRCPPCRACSRSADGRYSPVNGGVVSHLREAEHGSLAAATWSVSRGKRM